MRFLLIVVLAVSMAGLFASTTTARDRPFSTADLIAMKWAPIRVELDSATSGIGGGNFSKEQIEAFT